jgi:hypothetical protein
MALKACATPEVIADNVAGLVAVGYTQDRASEIAQASQRVSASRKRPRRQRAQSRQNA